MKTGKKIHPVNKPVAGGLFKALVVIILMGFILMACTPTGTPTTTSVQSSTPTSSTPTTTVTTTSQITETPLPTSTTKPTTSSPTTVTTSTVVPQTTSTTTTTTTPTTESFPSTFFSPSATLFQPTGELMDIFQYLLSLINKDRQDNQQPPVTLDFNAAAQKHAQDMFDNYYSGHWGTDGYKPYMRYTQEGGLNYEAENSAYSGWYNSSDNPANYNTIDVRQELAYLEHQMMYNDASSNWGHRDAIISKWAKKVSLGIVYDEHRLAFVEQFQGDYINYYSPPTISGTTLSFSGQFVTPDFVINNVSVAFDALPQPLSNSQLTTDPAYTNSYGLGDRVGIIIKPPPEGQTYASLPSEAIVANKWVTNTSGQFSVEANIGQLLTRGSGIYTVVIVATVGSEEVHLTNYSLFVK